MYSDLFNTGLSKFMEFRNKLRVANSDSLISFTDVTRVEPVVLIDQAVMHYDSLSQIQQSLLAMFSGYYLQAIALTNNLGGVQVIDRLEPLNPHRKADNVLLGGSSWLLAAEDQKEDPSSWMLSTEAYKDGLPMPSNEALKVAVEAEANKPEKGDESVKVGFTGDVGKALNELANLSVGKTYGVEISEGQNKATVPVAIRLIATAMATPELIHILSIGSTDNSWKERWHGWRSGRLAFWKDLVLCNDIIDQHRRDLANDNSGVITKINKIQRSNQLATLVSGNPTVSSSSNMVVLAKETADELELQLEGKLDKFEVRQRMMKNTYLMIVAVVDNDYQRVTFYHRGIPLPTTVRIADLKNSNKGNGPDVADILKAYTIGQAPTL